MAKLTLHEKIAYLAKLGITSGTIEKVIEGELSRGGISSYCHYNNLNLTGEHRMNTTFRRKQIPPNEVVIAHNRDKLSMVGKKPFKNKAKIFVELVIYTRYCDLNKVPIDDPKHIKAGFIKVREAMHKMGLDITEKRDLYINGKKT